MQPLLPLYRYDKSGNRTDNITDWGLEQFHNHYKDKKIQKEDIFHYTYAVLHNPAYRQKYELNLKREFPRIPFYEDFRKWAKWGKALMDLHIDYETAEPFDLKEHHKEAKTEKDVYPLLPSTPLPSTPLPSTPLPSTPLPSTPLPSTPLPSTPLPSTPLPSTPLPSTPLPSTPLPSTPLPSTPLPSTPLPSTPLPSTPLPSTPLPSTPLPSTPLPSTPLPSTPLPSTPLRKRRDTASLSERSRRERIKPKLKADKEKGVIEIDELTFLTGIPKEAWEYKLGNRSALEWILDQYKEKKPKDPTIAEKFNTYCFADYKEHVIDLLKRVCTVSVETMKIIEEMK